jgi:hypothetical protein
MFREHSFRILLVFLILFSLGLNNSKGQVSDTAKTALKERALKQFESGDFEDALFDYLILMDKFPRDPMYKYYCGVCMVEMNLEYEEAIEMLHFSSTRGVPADVYYYLGEAYRRMYNFQKSKQYFLQFDKEASRAMARKQHSKLHVRSVQTASRITSEYNPFEVINVTSMNLHDQDQYSQVRMKGGILQKKPKEFYSEGEDSDDLNSLMFMPVKVDRGDYVYFSGYDKGGKNGTQIFQAKKGNTGKWNDIKPVSELNTELDEILPYYDPVGKDIYFASNGLEGVGGFDLYRSHFDEERNEWSAPINLGFPINSAFDDYLLLPGKDLGMVMFFTGRNGTDTSTTVYRVHFSEPKISLASASPKEIQRIANLGSVSTETQKEIATQIARAQKKEPKPVKKNVAPKMTEWKIKENAPASKVVEASTPKVNNEYQSMVADALRYQTVSDSLTELSTSARIKVRDSEDPNDRWLYQKQILVWEKKAGTEQQMADDLYGKIAAYKPSAKTELPEAIEKEKEIGNIRVYKFKETVKEAAREKPIDEENEVSPVEMKPELKKEPSAVIAETNVVPENKVNEPVKAAGKALNRFVVLSASPYTNENPIPVNPELPSGSFYRIQIGAFSKPVKPDAFGGLSPITAETIPERGLTKYYAGKFSHYEDAVKAQSVLRSSGYETAYIVSWYNGSTMTLEKVRKLER